MASDSFPFKCIQSIIPQAENAVFLKDWKDELHFLQWEKDSWVDEKDTGYSSVSLGDSGSPYWRPDKKFIFDVEDRATLLAIHSRHLDLEGIHPATYVPNRRHECKILATKVSTNVIEWIEMTLKDLLTPSGQPLEEFIKRLPTTLGQ